MNVLVVGAGPAGATTALLLARYGIDVTLVERETSFERVFRGEGLMPLGIDALFQMGLQEALASVPYRLVLSWDIWIDGEEAFTIPEPTDELREHAMRVVSQPALLERVVDPVGDIVAGCLTMSGTHEGPLMGMPPTGRSVRQDHMHFVRLRDG